MTATAPLTDGSLEGQELETTEGQRVRVKVQRPKGCWCVDQGSEGLRLHGDHSMRWHWVPMAQLVRRCPDCGESFAGLTLWGMCKRCEGERAGDVIAG